ncbi:MAG: DUF3376 domain-containing protein, partial [Alphaproteobacteria bacterium]|nr:DUF3376 domain-containing protein [Alphaproteobacteria bacterium]
DPTKVVAFAQTGEDGRPPPWLRFLLAFDIDFRVRRLRFCIRGLNHLYERIGATEMNGVTTADLDHLKASLYENLDLYRNYLTRESLDATTLKDAQALLGEALSERALGHPEAAAQRFVAANAERIDALVRRIMAQIDLESVNYLVDEFFANQMGAKLRGAARRSMLADYIGFPFWDVLTFSITSWRDLGEFDEVRIDRVSPTDATFLRGGGAEATLKGIEFNHFGAFLSRAYRENDYLWGRLHAAERIIDLIVDAAKIEGAAEGVDVTFLKRKALTAILEAEKAHLETMGPDIAALEATLARR